MATDAVNGEVCLDGGLRQPELAAAASTDTDEDEDEGFESRPASASSVSRPRLSSSSSVSSTSDDEIFWGEQLASTKYLEAEKRLQAYEDEVELHEAHLDADDYEARRRCFYEFKAKHPLLRSSAYTEFEAGEAAEAAEAAAAAETTTQTRALPTDEGESEETNREERPLNLKKGKCDSADKSSSPSSFSTSPSSFSTSQPSSSTSSAASDLGTSTNVVSSRPSLETVMENCSEGEDSEATVAVQSERSKDQFAADDDDGLGEDAQIEDNAQIDLASTMAPLAASPAPYSASLTVADSATDIPSPAFLAATAAVASSTPRTSFSDAPLELPGQQEQQRQRGRKSSLSSLKDAVERERAKTALKAELLALKTKDLELKAKDLELEEEEARLEARVKISKKGTDDDDDVQTEQKSLNATTTPTELSLSSRSNGGILPWTPLGALPSDVVNGADDDDDAADEDDDAAATDDVIQRSPNLDRSSLNSTFNNSSIFGLSCRVPSLGVSGDDAEAAKAPQPTSSAPSTATKGVSYKPSPMKSPSVIRPAASSSSSALKKGVASTASTSTTTSTPGRSVAWKKTMFSSPANSSPSATVGLTPGKSALKKSSVKPVSTATMMTPPGNKRPLTPSHHAAGGGGGGSIDDRPNDGSPVLKSATGGRSASTVTPGRMPNKTLFNAAAAASRSPGVSMILAVAASRSPASAASARTAATSPSTGARPKQSGSSLGRSPALAASRGAMMARSPGGHLAAGKSAGLGRSPGSTLASGKSPGSTLASGRSPGASLVAGKSPGASLVAGKSHGASLVAGRSPGASLVAGRFPGASLVAGKSPGPSLVAGRSPGASLVAGKSPGPSLVAGRSPGPSLVAGRSPGAPLRNNTSANNPAAMTVNSPHAGKSPHGGASRPGFGYATPTSGTKRPAATTPNSGIPRKTSPRPTTPSSTNRPTNSTVSSYAQVRGLLTPKSLSFKPN